MPRRRRLPSLSRFPRQQRRHEGARARGTRLLSPAHFQPRLGSVSVLVCKCGATQGESTTQVKVTMSRLINDWSNETNLLFLRTYFQEHVLWDPRHKHHKEKSALAEAWERISIAMATDIMELKKKRESLMATFRSHVRKKKASINNGATGSDIYQPGWFAYELMESYLGPVYDCNVTANLDNVSENSPNSIDAHNVKSEMDEDASLLAAEDSGSALPTMNDVSSPGLRARQPAKRRRKGFEAVTEPIMYSSYSPLLPPHIPNIPNENHYHSDHDDECDLFCRLLSKKLRKLPETEREMFMYQIDGMFINRMRQMNRPPSPSCSYGVPSPTVHHD